MTKTKRFLTLFAAIVMAGGVNAQQLADYSVTVGNETFTSIASTGHLLSSVTGDGGSQTVALPFNFRFGETSYAQGATLTVRADGYVYFGTTSAGHNPTSSYTNSYTDYYVICPVMGGDGKITADSVNSGAYAVDTVDANGDSLLVIEFKDLQCYYTPNGSYNYQLRLHANGDISVLFNTSTASTYSSVKQNFFMLCGRNDKVCLTGSWASPVLGTPSTLTDLGTSLPEAGTVITYVRPTAFCPRVTDLAVSAITSDGATLSWTGADNALGYAVSYGEYSDEVSDASLTLTGLNPSTAYTVSVRAICGAGDTSAAVSASFYTTCVNISTTDSAYTEDFESWSTAASDFNPCWNRLYADFDYESYSSTSTNYMPVVSSTFAHSGLQSLRMRSYFYLDDYYSGDADDASIAFMPVFESDVRSLNLRFWYKAGSNPSYLRLAVGVSTTIADTSTFARLLTIAPADTAWHEYEVELLGYSGTGNRITFIQYSEDGAYSADFGYIDDIRVEELGDCFRPAAVSVSELTPTSATITWTELNTVGAYQIVVNGDESTATNVAGDTTTVLTLEANTEYTVSVSTLCNGEYTEARSISFRTPCNPVAHDELPWNQNFDNVEASGNAPIDVPCMTFNVGHGYYYFPYTNANVYYGASGKSLYFYTSSGYEPQIVALPLFEDAINTLQLSFYSRVSSTAAAFEVGTMTNPFDPTTFVPFDTTVATATQTWEYQQFSFADYDGQGSYIAIRPMTFSGSYLYLDNLSVGNITECARVASVTVDSLTAHYVHLAIADSVEQNSYLVEIVSGNDTIRENIYTNEFSVDTLHASTSYTVNVYTVCADATTAPVTISFTTPCEAVAMPFIEDFNSISNISNLNCWSFYNGLYIDSTQSANLASGNNWTRHTTAMEGSSHVKLNIYGTNCKYWLVTPEISITSANAALSFDYALTAYNNANAPSVSNVADDRFLVLATVNGGNTWTVLAAWDSSANNNSYAAISNTVQSASISLSQYDGQNIRIAFYGESTVGGGDNDLHIDNIVVESLDCAPTSAPVVETVSSDEATISWTGTGNFEYRYAPAADTTNWTLVSTSDSSASLSGLTANTEYLFQVHTDCGSGLTSRWMTVSFRTACAAIDTLPWSDDFESYSNGVFNIPCWVNEHISGSGSSLFGITTSSSTGNNTKLLYLPDMSNGTMTKLMLPLMDIPAGQSYMFSVDVYRNATGTSFPNEGVRVFASTNGSIEGATELGFLYRNYTQTDNGMVSAEAASGWYTYQFPIPFSGNCYIILRGESTYGSATYMDNFAIMEVPSCMRPSSVAVSDVTTSGATLTIADANETNHYYVVLGTDSVEVNGNTYTFTSLNPATAYTVRVYTACSDGTVTADFTTADFTTACAAFSIPYTTSFENETNSATPGCWTNFSGNTFARNSTSGNSNGIHSGSMYLDFRNSLRNMVALPQFTEEISGLQVRFWTSPESFTNASCGKLMVGYLTDLSDTSTFVALATYNYNDFSAMEEKEVPMTGAPAGSYIAFLHAAGSTGWYWFIDDVTVEPVASCQRPQSVSVDAVAATSATIHVHDANQANSYVYRLYSNNTLVDSVAFTDSIATISGLNPSTSYEVSVATLCSGELSNTVTTSFFTDCMAIANLPWNEDFEAWSTGNSNVNPCWNRLYYSAYSSNPSVTSYPYASSDAAYNNSSKSLLFYSSYDSEDGDSYSIAMLPEFTAAANTLSLSFWYKVSSTYDADFVNLAVGVTSTTADTTGFVRLATIAPVDYDWHQYTVDLSAYTGTGNRIAIMQLSIDGNEEDDGTTYYDYSTAYGYVDDIVVELAGSNPPQPTMHTVTVSSANAAMGTATASATSVEDGTSVTLTATANSGYHFVNWTANGAAVSTANPFTFTVTSDTTLVANFEANTPDVTYYTVSASSADATMGSATVSPNGQVAENTSVTFTATANDGYHFVNWTANGTAVSSANPFTFTVTSDTALVANFEADSTEPEECIDPANVTASLVTSSSAMISWTAGGSEPRWAIDYNGTVDTTDSNPYTLFGLQPGTTYYVKVRALCANGNVSGWTNAVSFTTENEPTGIDDIDNSAIALYPNPATTSVTLSGIAGRATVSVVDMNGRVSGTWNVENGELTIDLTGYAQGAYFVRITGEQQTAIRKLIVK